MKVTTAGTAGFCFGVTRAVDMCRQTLERYGSCRTLGPLIHNTHVVETLEREGAVPADGVGDIRPGDVVLIRSHGVTVQELGELERMGCTVVDATCPFVARIHGIVREESEKGNPIVIVGEREHPEVRGIASRCGIFRVIGGPEELPDVLSDPAFSSSGTPVMVSQTTGDEQNYKKCSENMKKICTNAKVFDTICLTTSMRQKEAADLSSRSDAMVVIGGRGSANTQRLAEICERYCSRVVRVECAEELDLSLFSSYDRVGVTAGASTPS